MIFEWDEEKEYTNFIKHRVLFEDAEHIFDDPRRIERIDEDEHNEEDRWQTMGMADKVLFVVYTERGDSTRIISARVAKPYERRIYYGNSEKYPRGWRKANS